MQLRTFAIQDTQKSKYTAWLCRWRTDGDVFKSNSQNCQRFSIGNPRLFWFFARGQVSLDQPYTLYHRLLSSTQ